MNPGSDLGDGYVVGLEDLSEFLFGIGGNHAEAQEANRNNEKESRHTLMIARGMGLAIFCCNN